MAGHSKPRMIRTVLIYAGGVFVFGLVVFWLLSGGLAGAFRSAKDFLNPLDKSPTGTHLRLPWQPAEITRGPDVYGSPDNADQTTESWGAENRATIEAQYGSQVAGYDPLTFGNPSPYVDHIFLTGQAASENDPAREYVELRAAPGNSAPIQISGWSLQSAVSGLRIGIPLGAPHFVLGVINSVQPIYLDPGVSAIVTTGPSPVGTSFRENICSGYLNELQTFTPKLSSECVAPSTVLPLAADTIRTYGETCIDYIHALPRCHFPKDTPANLSLACHAFLTNTLSYNGCVRAQSSGPYFAILSWRIYMGMRANAWGGHDVIRLLDERGQVVDVLTY